MSKFSSLIKNTGILAIGNFGSKLLSFFMVPVYTAVLTTSDYGSFDIILSTVSLLIPLLTLDIADAMLRFPLDESSDKTAIAQIGIGISLASGAIVLFLQLTPAALWANVDGVQYVTALYVTQALYQTLLMLARGLERMTDVAVAGILSTSIIAALNIVLLVVFHLGLNGFLIANVLGVAIGVLYLLIRLRRVVFAGMHFCDSVLLRKMVRYSLPLSMAALGLWLINTSGRYIVTAFCGIDANGLYSIAFKIPTVLSTIATVFIQAWQVSAIKEFDPKDSDGFLTRVFFDTEMALVLICSGLIVASPGLAMILFSGDFFLAWEYVPFLLVLVVFNTMGGVWGPFFSVVYDTLPIIIATVLGGTINVCLGIPLTIEFGIWGVIGANIVACAANWAYRGLKVRKHIKADFHMARSLLIYGILVAQGILTVAAPLPLGLRLAGSLVFLCSFLVYYRNNLGSGFKAMYGLAKRRVGGQR